MNVRGVVEIDLSRFHLSNHHAHVGGAYSIPLYPLQKTRCPKLSPQIYRCASIQLLDSGGQLKTDHKMLGAHILLLGLNERLASETILAAVRFLPGKPGGPAYPLPRQTARRAHVSNTARRGSHSLWVAQARIKVGKRCRFGAPADFVFRAIQSLRWSRCVESATLFLKVESV